MAVPRRRRPRRSLREVTTPAAADRLVRETVGEISVARDALVHAAGPVWWFVRPLASRVTVEENRAEASVWVVTVLSAADVALPQADWLTLDMDLAWRGGRWLLESIEGPDGLVYIAEESVAAYLERVGFGNVSNNF